MQRFISWCNDNGGVLGVITLLASIILVGYGWVITALITFSLLLLFFFFSKKSVQSQSVQLKPEAQVRQLEAPKKEDVRSNPKEILEYLEKLTPYDRQIISKKYKGLHVSWRVIFSTITSSSKGQYLLIVCAVGNKYHSIFCHVKLAEYPQLKTLNTGEEFTIKGIIESVNSINGDVGLKKCILLFD